MPRRKSTGMHSSKKIRELAPEEVRSAVVRKFRSVVRVVDGVNPRPAPYDTLCGMSGMFDALSEDVIARVIECVLQMRRCNTGLLDMLDEAASTRASVVNFALSCNRVAVVLRTITTDAKAEVIARGATKIAPLRTDVSYPFTLQMRNEMLSCEQFKMLRAAENSMACHCAKACCLKYQKAFNRDIRKGRVFMSPSSKSVPRALTTSTSHSQVVPVLESCGLLAATPEGSAAFAYLRKRLSKLGARSEGRQRRFVETIAKVKRCEQGNADFPVEAELELDTSEVSAPLTMRVSNDGSAVAYISALHPATQQQDCPFSSVCVWTVGSSVVQLEQPSTCLEEWVYLSAQDAWFLDSCDDAVTVVVAWSTDFVHPSGHHVGSHALVAHGPAYMFATYTVEDGCVELSDVTSMHPHLQLISCSPTHAGTSALVLAKRMSTYDSPSRRSTYLHDIINNSVRITVGGTHTQRGPLCAAISPSGDCAVKISRTEDSIVADVMVRMSRDGFGATQTIDVSPWISLSGTGDHPPASDLVKATLGLTFSYCGRFVAIMDRHPLFGDAPSNHGVVIIDTALRMDKFRALRPHPVFATEEQAPRSLQWTKNGFWMMPPGTDEQGAIGSRGGALVLYCPRVASLL